MFIDKFKTKYIINFCVNSNESKKLSEKHITIQVYNTNESDMSLLQYPDKIDVFKDVFT